MFSIIIVSATLGFAAYNVTNLIITKAKNKKSNDAFLMNQYNNYKKQKDYYDSMNKKEGST